MVEATDKDREKNIKKDMQEMKQRYDTVNSKLGNLETRMNTMSRDQAASSCTIESKLDAILRNSITQDNLVTNRTRENTGGQDNYENWNRKYDEWSRRFHDEQ